MKYKLFIDSITLKISFQDKRNKVLEYDYFVSELINLGYKPVSEINKKYIAKFNYMYLLRKSKTNLLHVFTFSNDISSKSIFFVYALKHGIYIEVNGLMQYEKDYRLEKYQLLHILWKNYCCILTKLDVALDLEAKFSDIHIFCSKEKKLLNLLSKSKSSISYYKVSNGKQRHLKLYYKSTQRFRKFPLAIDLTRLELTLKSQKLRNLLTVNDFSSYFFKEFLNFDIYLSNKKMYLTFDTFNGLFQNLFSFLDRGKFNKSYSNYFKNIDIKVKNMELAWNSLYSKDTIQTFSKKQGIGLTCLKKYRKYYKDVLD